MVVVWCECVVDLFEVFDDVVVYVDVMQVGDGVGGYGGFFGVMWFES